MSIKIDITKVNEAVIDRYLATYGIKSRGGLNAKLQALEKYQTDLDNVPKEQQSAACTNCGGESDLRLPECPYCGTKEIEDGPPAEASTEVVEPVVVLTHEPLEPVQDPIVSDVKPEPLAAAPEVQVAVPMQTTGGQRMRRVERTKEKTKSNGTTTTVVTTTGAELAASGELDAAVVRVQVALRSGANSYWDLGSALLDIFEKKLWKQRIVGGKQAFSSWNLFCRDELNMSHVNAFSIMDTARAFSRKDFEDLGHSKLQLLLRLPKERQQVLLEEARKGQLPRARLKEIVEGEVPKGERRETGRKNANNPRLAEAGAAGTEKLREKAAMRKAERDKNKATPRPDGELTAVSQLGRTKIKLYARPNPKKPKEKPMRAVSITLDPWGEEVLVNGVVVRYTVMKAAAGWELLIERKRAE